MQSAQYKNVMAKPMAVQKVVLLPRYSDWRQDKIHLVVDGKCFSGEVELMESYLE